MGYNWTIQDGSCARDGLQSWILVWSYACRQKCYLLASLVIIAVVTSCNTPDFDNCPNGICNARVNVKDGARQDGKQYENFDVAGSSGKIHIPQTWPNFKLGRKNPPHTQVFHHNSYAWNSKGETSSNGSSKFSPLVSCVGKDDAKVIGVEKLARSNGSKSDRVTFYVEGTPFCPSGKCTLYMIQISPENMRFTADEANCAVNIDIMAKPLKIGGQYICSDCQ